MLTIPCGKNGFLSVKYCRSQDHENQDRLVLYSQVEQSSALLPASRLRLTPSGRIRTLPFHNPRLLTIVISRKINWLTQMTNERRTLHILDNALILMQKGH